jgi:hypothetical protein
VLPALDDAAGQALGADRRGDALDSWNARWNLDFDWLDCRCCGIRGHRFGRILEHSQDERSCRQEASYTEPPQRGPRGRDCRSDFQKSLVMSFRSSANIPENLRNGALRRP